jgi:transposase
MRRADETIGSLFGFADMEERIPARRPLREIGQVANYAPTSLDGAFNEIWTGFGRPSIPPGHLIRAGLLQILFSVRSERQLMGQMVVKLMFRWFFGLRVAHPGRNSAVFTKNRDRLPTTGIARKVMAEILAHREVAPLMSDEHFSVDGRLIYA